MKVIENFYYDEPDDESDDDDEHDDESDDDDDEPGWKNDGLAIPYTGIVAIIITIFYFIGLIFCSLYPESEGWKGCTFLYLVILGITLWLGFGKFGEKIN